MRISRFRTCISRPPGSPIRSAPQAFLATLDGGDLGGVIELLETTTDAKTLGSPKLLVLNEQEARLQVGEHLGFKVTTTTETSTLESVQFLDVGVVLRITPRITRDGRVLLHVKPEVSKGAVNPETGLPESQTAELETDVMLNDGQGMVIGGLIKENDTVPTIEGSLLGQREGRGLFVPALGSDQGASGDHRGPGAADSAVRPAVAGIRTGRAGEGGRAAVARAAVPHRSAVGSGAARWQARVLPAHSEEASAAHRVISTTSDRST